MSVGQMHILGIDVALLLPDGKFRSEVIPNTSAGFEKLASAFLAAQGHAVSVVNPAQMLRSHEPHQNGQERCPAHRPLLR